MRFVKSLNLFDEYRKGHFINMNTPILSNFPKNLNENHNFIIVDSACENTRQLLSEVNYSN